MAESGGFRQRGWGRWSSETQSFLRQLAKAKTPCASRSTDQCQDGVDLAVEHDSRVRKCLYSISLGKARHSGA